MNFLIKGYLDGDETELKVEFSQDANELSIKRVTFSPHKEEFTIDWEELQMLCKHIELEIEGL